jgi:hypothetical protein
MKQYQEPTIKIMVTIMTDSFIAASSDFTIVSDQTGVMPVIPGGSSPSDAI